MGPADSLGEVVLVPDVLGALPEGEESSLPRVLTSTPTTSSAITAAATSSGHVSGQLPRLSSVRPPERWGSRCHS